MFKITTRIPIRPTENSPSANPISKLEREFKRSLPNNPFLRRDVANFFKSQNSTEGNTTAPNILSRFPDDKLKHMETLAGLLITRATGLCNAGKISLSEYSLIRKKYESLVSSAVAELERRKTTRSRPPGRKEFRTSGTSAVELKKAFQNQLPANRFLRRAVANLIRMNGEIPEGSPDRSILMRFPDNQLKQVETAAALLQAWAWQLCGKGEFSHPEFSQICKKYRPLAAMAEAEVRKREITRARAEVNYAIHKTFGDSALFAAIYPVAMVERAKCNPEIKRPALAPDAPVLTSLDSGNNGNVQAFSFEGRDYVLKTDKNRKENETTVEPKGLLKVLNVPNFGQAKAMHWERGREFLVLERIDAEPCNKIAPEVKLQSVTDKHLEDLARAFQFARQNKVYIDEEHVDNLLYNPAQGFTVIDVAEGIPPTREAAIKLVTDALHTRERNRADLASRRHEPTYQASLERVSMIFNRILVD